MVATIVNGTHRVTLSDDIRTALGLDEGAVVVPERRGTDIVLRAASGAELTVEPPDTQAPGSPSARDESGPASSINETRRGTPETARSSASTAEQRAALDRMLASRRTFPNQRILDDDGWDEAIAQAIVEDFRSEDYGDEADTRR
jgi:bifunctional DNA-binding transcriptional regulator/antitoxin component of YhaV-PrlF toxin-antitoxin module